MDTKQKETYQKWKRLVNMSASELRKFYESEEGKKAGLKPSEAKAEGIDYGRESARWILKMKETSVKEWTPTMWKWANKQISFISRMSGNKGGLYDEKGNKTRKHLSLLIWGNNPEKYETGGDLSGSKKINTFTKKYIDYVISGKSKDSNEKLIKSASNFIRAKAGAIKESIGSKQFKQKENELLIEFAIENGLILDLPKQSLYISEGSEQHVYEKTDETVVKLNSGVFYQSWSEYFDSLLLHNHFFPDTRYDFVGVSISGDDVFAVVEQLFIVETEPTDLKKVEQVLAENGFVKTKGNDYINHETGIILEDLHESNVITKDGVLYFIDTVFYLKNPYSKFKSGGSATNKKYKMKKNDCIEFLKNNESVLKNGYYHEFDGIILLTYNSGGKDNLPVHQTVNMNLADKLQEILKIDQYSAFRIMENHSEKAKRFHDIEDAYEFYGKEVIIADRDRIVCHDIKEFKEGGEVNKESKMDKPKNNVALYTRVKGEKQFKASDFKGNQVDRLVNAPLVSPDKFDEFLKAIKQTAEQNKDVDFRIKEFGTNKIWYDSQISKGTKVELEHKDTIEEIASGKLTTEEAAQKIAEDHIEEDKLYYDKLEEMEGIIDGEPEKETINKIGEQFKVSRSWVDEKGSYTNDPSKRAKVLIRVAHKAEVMILFYPSLSYPNKVTNQEAVDIFIKEKNVKEAIIYSPRSVEELKKSLSLAKSKGIAESAIYDIQKNYFSDVVSNDPTKLGEFLLAIDGLTKKERFNFQMELNDRYGNTEAIDRFSDNLEKKGYNIYDLLPTEFKKQTKVKRIDFTPSPESEGLAKITDLFVGSDDLRPVMTGVYFDKENDLISATDAHKMIVIAQKPDVEKSSICMMGKNLKTDMKNSALPPEKYQDTKNSDGCFEIEGRYPDYIRVIPTDYSEIFDFNANHLMNYAETMSKHLTNTTTRQMLIGYKSEENGDVVIGVNAVFLATVLKGMQMLGHETLDFCHNGMANKAMVFVPKGQSRKITNKRIETDLSLCVTIMVENDNMPIYDLTDNTIKTVAQFYGREVKQEEVTLEPIIEPIPIEVIDPIEPVEEVSISPVLESEIKQENMPKESKEIREAIDGLEILLLSAKSKKEKSEINGAIDGLKILLEDTEKFEMGGELTPEAKELIGKEVYVQFRNERGIVDGIQGDYVQVRYPNLGFSELLDYTSINNKIFVTDENSDYGLNWRIGSYGQEYSDYKMGTIYKQSGGTYGARVGFGTNIYLFKTLIEAIQWVDYRTAELRMDQLGELIDDEDNPTRKQLLRDELKVAQSVVHSYERKDEKFELGGQVNPNEIISELPNP